MSQNLSATVREKSHASLFMRVASSVSLVIACQWTMAQRFCSGIVFGLTSCADNDIDGCKSLP